MENIPVFKPYINVNTLKHLINAFHVGWLGMGATTKDFETRISAMNDDYAGTGNVALAVAAVAGVLNNDLGAGLQVTEVPGAAVNVGPATATNQGGSVTLAADGSFTYAPPVGYRGTDTYTYQAGDGSATGDAIVTITVGDMIWFIDNSAGSPGDGRISSPFSTLAAFQLANAGAAATDPQTGDAIFVAETGADYTGGVSLKNTQVLIGEGATQSITALASITLAPHSVALPATGGSSPTIVGGAPAPPSPAIVRARSTCEASAALRVAGVVRPGTLM